MDYFTLLTEVIDRGIVAAEIDYLGKKNKRDGAIAGLNECRDKNPEELEKLLKASKDRVELAFQEEDEDYWYWSCRQNEIHWVCNCISATLQATGFDIIVPPTARAYQHVAKILGYKHSAA